MKSILYFFSFIWVGEFFRTIREFNRTMDALYPKKQLFEFTFPDVQQYKDWTRELKKHSEFAQNELTKHKIRKALDASIELVKAIIKADEVIKSMAKSMKHFLESTQLKTNNHD